MTNEEAREQLKDIARSFSREYFHDWREALDVAIKALEQQPCEDCISREAFEMAIKVLEQQPSEDCISRQAVIDYAKDTCLDLDKYEDTEVFCDEIKAMPSVTPKSEDIKEAYLKGYDYGVKDWFKSKTQPCEDAASKQIRDCENCIHYKDGGCEVWECKFEAKEEESEDSDEETETR